MSTKTLVCAASDPKGVERLDCFLPAQNSAKNGQILGVIYIYICARAVRLEMATVFQRRNIYIKAVLRRTLFDCFLAAQNLPGLAKFWDIYICIYKCARAVRLEVATAFQRRNIAALCCVKCALTVF